MSSYDCYVKMQCEAGNDNNMMQLSQPLTIAITAAVAAAWNLKRKRQLRAILQP